MRKIGHYNETLKRTFSQSILQYLPPRNVHFLRIILTEIEQAIDTVRLRSNSNGFHLKTHFAQYVT